MSVVTNAILVTAPCDWRDDADEVLPSINAYFGQAEGFKALADAAVGGSKNLECHVYVGAFDGLDLPALVDHLRSLPWEQPEAVQLVIREQHDGRFRIVDVFCPT